MSFADWDENEIKIAKKGMNLLGWQLDPRWTSDEAYMINEIALEAIKMEDNNSLTDIVIQELSKKMFKVLCFQIMNIEERARMICGRYNKSLHLSSLIPLIDESLMCYYRGYHTACLALLFIILEKCLRSIAGWIPGKPDPTFAELRESVNNLPNPYSSNLAYNIIKIIYSRYDPTNPPLFYFNRHGLLHGLRGAEEVDIMNCSRIYQLFDIICSAENIGNSIYGKDMEDFRSKVDIFRKCIF